MRNQIVISACVISVGYPLIGIVIKGYCELNYIKLGNQFHIYGNFIVARKQRWFHISCQNLKSGEISCNIWISRIFTSCQILDR